MTIMKRRYYLFPLMAVTALSLSLAACDDNKTEDTSALTEATTEAAPIAADVAATAAINAEGATAYATAEGQANGAVFLTLHNPQTAPDKLVGASTPVATSVELHESSIDANGVATMTKVDAIEIQPGQQVSLTPDGYHIMLLGLTAPLAEGTPFDITLDFETAADVILPVTVTAPAATTGAADAHDHSGEDATHDTTTETVPTDTTASTPTTDESPVVESDTTGTVDETSTPPTSPIVDDAETDTVPATTEQ